MKKAVLIITLSSEAKELSEELKKLLDIEIAAAYLRKKDSIKNEILKLIKENVSNITVFPLFVLRGRLYNDAVNEVLAFKYSLNINILNPIIDSYDDFCEIVKAVNGNENTVYCIHKSDITFNFKNELIWQTESNTEKLADEIKKRNLMSVNLQPIMIGTGYHFKNDVLNILKPSLENKGIAVNPINKGLLDYKAVRNIIIKRIVNNYEFGTKTKKIKNN